MIPFSLYMYRWLYGKNGYYASMLDIGKNGDFYTSVSTSMFFGGSIANYLIRSIDKKNLNPDITLIEIGAHKGYLLADIIQFIYTLRPELLKILKFAVIEPLPKIQKAQEQYFKNSFGDTIHVDIVNSIKSISCKEAFIVSNELFDAFKCEVINNNKMLYMYESQPKFGDLSNDARDISEKYNIMRGEITLGLDTFAKDICQNFENFEFLSFDYGQMEPRGDISLRVYKNHNVYPFFELTKYAGNSNRVDEFFANSDITHDVCFLHVKDVFEKMGARMTKFCTQMVALNEFGITDLLEILHKNVDEKVYKMELEKAKQLILPNFLGERFKMIIFRKD